MKLTPAPWTRDGYTLRLARAGDAEAYFHQGFDPLDPEVARLTGCKRSFTYDEVVPFFLSHMEDESRYDFLLLDPDGNILGESVVNEIDFDARTANFRICLFRPAARGKGLGTWATEMTRDFAFGVLKLRRLELDVFSFNPRAERAYLAAGFVREGVLRQAIPDGDGWGDDILMAMLDHEWRALTADK